MEGKRKEENERGKTAFAAGFPDRDSHGTRTYKVPQGAEQQGWSRGDLRTLFAPENPPSRLRAEGTHYQDRVRVTIKSPLRRQFC